jgi:hypothetical protein
MTANAEDYLIDDDICGEQFGGGTLAFVNETGGDQNSQAGMTNSQNACAAIFNFFAVLSISDDKPELSRKIGLLN